MPLSNDKNLFNNVALYIALRKAANQSAHPNMYGRAHCGAK
jgi:hypothetical protein